MCTEIHHRFRPCHHTRFLHWDYCSVIIPSDRLPETGRACRRYKVKYKFNQHERGCFDCMKESMVRKPVYYKDAEGKKGLGPVKMMKWVFGRQK
jgi:hypothetical protein